MTLYTRHQLLLVLLLVGAAGGGLAIDHWRRASPDLVERLERVDRPARAATPDVRAPEGRRARRSAPRDDDAAGRRERRTRADHAPRRVIAPDAPLDVNRADAPELARLPGIGPTLAARIVAARPFEALDDLVRVRGLRRAALERVRPLLALSPP